MDLQETEVSERGAWKSRRTFVAFAAIWAAAVGVGLSLLTGYSAQAGEGAAAPVTWPSDSVLSPNQDEFTLAMMVHPKCPCSRASIGELAKLMRRVDEKVDAHVFFTRPTKMKSNWEQTDLWDSASRIPGVTVHADPGGRQARLLGSKTSGQVVLYGRDQALLFAGGITPARSHMGDNRGTFAVERLVNEDSPLTDNTAVYGCELFSGDER